jgi:hypothetical protein
MDAAINYLLRDSSTLKGTIDKNREKMNENGFAEESYTALSTFIQNLKTKETAQEMAVKDAINKTAEQNQLINKAQSIVKDLKASAKSAYGTKSHIIKMFKIGENIPGTVKTLNTLCSYMVKLVDERKADLIKNGFPQSKIDILAEFPGQLDSTDDAQEYAKKLQKSKTMERDSAAKDLKEQAAKIRNFAKSCFSDKPEILIQFDPIPKGRGESTEEKTTAAAGTTTTTTTSSGTETK